MIRKQVESVLMNPVEPELFAESLLESASQKAEYNKVWVWSHIILREDFTDFIKDLFGLAKNTETDYPTLKKVITTYQERYADSEFYKLLSVHKKELFDDIFLAIIAGHARIWHEIKTLCFVPIAYHEGIHMTHNSETEETILTIKDFVTPTELREFIFETWDLAMGNARGGINTPRKILRKKTSKNHLRNLQIYNKYSDFREEGFNVTESEAKTSTWVEKNFPIKDNEFALDTVRKIVKEIEKRKKLIN